MKKQEELTWADLKAMQAKTDKQMQKTDRKIQAGLKRSEQLERMINRMCKEIGGISNSNGEVAESYFINSFKKHPQFAGQNYDSLTPNLSKSSSTLNLRDEYDLVLYNCTSVAIIEIKYKARKEDIDQLLRKAQTFKQLFPEYANYDIYLGLAGLHVNITAEKEAIKQGMAVIKQVGENMLINDTHLKVF
jgi:hypothetical protein